MDNRTIIQRSIDYIEDNLQTEITAAELAERNVRIYDLCYAATAVRSESFDQDNEKWLAVYRDILRGYDRVAHLSDEERRAVPPCDACKPAGLRVLVCRAGTVCRAL